MKIPKTINLLGEKYKIIIKDKSTEKEKNHADIDFGKKEIVIDKFLSEKEKNLALWHELGHFFFDYYHVAEDDEVLAEAFAKFIISIKRQLRMKKK